MPRVAVQLLFGQNPEPFLKYAIRSVKDWVDYWTICNTDPNGANGDENVTIASEELEGKEVRYTELQPDENGHFSFADARNTCISQTDTGDFILILDADDVHYPHFEQIVKEAISRGADSLTANFYHLMVYKDIYQYTQPREILYKNYPGTSWEKGVHELLQNQKGYPEYTSYHYMHYGYVKPQREVFDRWKFYSDLEGDYHHYDGQNPETILDDRVAVCKPLTEGHPPAIAEYIDGYPDAPKERLRNSPPASRGREQEAVGLLLLTFNDEAYLDQCFHTLADTVLMHEEAHISVELLVIDCNSTDGSIDKLIEWKSKLPFPVEIVASSEYTSLSETLNFGFDHFRVQEKFRYVGWIHPDMEFVQPYWLFNLWRELQENEDWGKVCSANFRDMLPLEAHPGQEQCFIMRKDILHKIGLFDEGYVGIGGYEDWDMNRRILMHSGPAGHYKVMITPKSWVMHHGMGTRSKRDTTGEQIANSRHYYSKWQTWEPAV